MKRDHMTQELIKEYTRVAFYYYKSNLTQDEIAKKMTMSRQRVNRILKECVEYGIVQIAIDSLDVGNLELEKKLEEKYNLKEVRVVNNVIDENIHLDLGTAASKYLETVISDGDIIGFSRGRSTSALVDCFSKTSKTNLTVTQLLGSEHTDKHHVGVDDIVFRFSKKMNATPLMLYAPVIVENSKLKNSLMQESFFKNTYKVIQSCSIVVVGIGTEKSQARHMTGLSNMDWEKVEQWRNGVAGEICSHFFDSEGREMPHPFRDRIIAITLEDYMKIPLRIGVAGLPYKANAIKAALMGKYINVLVTDFETANILKE